MNYDFKVLQEPLWIEGKVFERNAFKVPQKKALINSETSEVISIVSDRYELVEHKEVIDMFNKLDNVVLNDVKLTQDGGIMFAKFNLPEVKPVEIAKGDIVNFYLRVFNSYNFKTGCGFELVGNRLVCTNGLVIPKTQASFSFKHMKNDGLARISNRLLSGTENLPKTIAKWQKWTRESVPVLPLKEFYQKLNLHEDTVQELMNKTTNCSNLWEAFNVLTAYTTHEIKCRGKNKLANQRKKEIDYINNFYKRF